MKGTTLQSLKTGTTAAIAGYIVINVGGYLQGEVTMSALLSAISLGVVAFMGRRAVKKVENGK